MKLKAAIMGVALAGAGTASAGVLFQENFDALSAGDLNGQGGWTAGAGNFNVTASTSTYQYTDPGTTITIGGGNVALLAGSNVSAENFGVPAPASVPARTSMAAPSSILRILAVCLVHGWVAAPLGTTRSGSKVMAAMTLPSTREMAVKPARTNALVATFQYP